VPGFTHYWTIADAQQRLQFDDANQELGAHDSARLLCLIWDELSSSLRRAIRRAYAHYTLEQEG